MYVNVKEYWYQIKMGTDPEGLNQINFAIILNMRITITRHYNVIDSIKRRTNIIRRTLLFTALSGVLLLFTKLNGVPSSLTGIQNGK